MARLQPDPNRLNRTVDQSGKEYQLRLMQRAQSIFATLLNLLPSNYASVIQGPNYTIELKAVAVELARLELALEDVDTDRAVATTRSEFLYSIIGYFIFINGRLPLLEFDDEEFRRLLVSLIRIYFQGSIPASIRDVVALFLDSGSFVVTENFLLVRAGASGLDISDEFGFQIDLLQNNNQFPPDVFGIDSTLRLLIDIIRPAHTLFRLRYIFTDRYEPNKDQGGRVLDAMRWRLANYYYEDFRRYCRGLVDRDRLGVKVNTYVTDEDHSEDF